MADSNYPIWIGVQPSLSTDGALRLFLNCWLRFRSAHDMLSLLTLAYWCMKTSALNLMLVLVRPSWDIALLGELAWGVLFRPWWLSTYLGRLNLTLDLEGDLPNYLPWWLHGKHQSTPVAFGGLSDGGAFKQGFWLTCVDLSKVYIFC